MPKRARQRGSIRQRGDAYEVRVYAGLDPVTKKPIYLTGSADSPSEAEKLRTKFLAQVDEKRHPRKDATVAALLDQWVKTHRVDLSTVERTDELIRLYLKPTFGKMKAFKLSTEMLELFYARLQLCKDQCEGKRNGKAGHVCEPLAPATVLRIHYIIRPALAAGYRWGYVTSNAAANAEKPSAPRPEPDPPSPEEAAAVLNRAWKTDPDWGMFLWLAMVAGCRRGELCGLQWRDVDFARQILTVKFSEQKLRRSKSRRKDTKTHQQRRIAFDSITSSLLGEHRARAQARCEALGIKLPQSGYVFSLQPDGSVPRVPNDMSHRYARLAKRLELGSTRLHSLRHYSATELISAGVDLRTVAGRLGHGDGGATTLRVYAAWSPSADARAAGLVSKRLPRPGKVNETAVTIVNGKSLGCQCGNGSSWSALTVDGQHVVAMCADCGAFVSGADPNALAEPAEDFDGEDEPSPYQKIASELRARMASGELGPGRQLPTLKEIMQAHGVSAGTAHRAVTLLTDEGLVIVRRGVRAVVRDPESPLETDS